MVGPFGVDARHQEGDAPRNELKAGPRITRIVMRDVIDLADSEAVGLMDLARHADGDPVSRAAPGGGDVTVLFTSATGQFTVTWEGR